MNSSSYTFLYFSLKRMPLPRQTVLSDFPQPDCKTLVHRDPSQEHTYPPYIYQALWEIHSSFFLLPDYIWDWYLAEYIFPALSPALLWFFALHCSHPRTTDHTLPEVLCHILQKWKTIPYQKLPLPEILLPAPLLILPSYRKGTKTAYWSNWGTP